MLQLLLYCMIIHTGVFKPGTHPQLAKSWLWACAWLSEIVFVKMCVYLSIYLSTYLPYVCPYTPMSANPFSGKAVSL